MAEHKGRGGETPKTPTEAGPERPALARELRGFLSSTERKYTRRDFIAHSSVATLVIAAGGLFLPSAAEARPARDLRPVEPAGALTNAETAPEAAGTAPG